MTELDHMLREFWATANIPGITLYDKNGSGELFMPDGNRYSWDGINVTKLEDV